MTGPGRVSAVWLAVAGCLAVVAATIGAVQYVGSGGHTGPNPAVVTTVPALCPPGLTEQVIGQISPPNHAPIQVVQCSASIPVNYAPGTGLVP